MTTSTRVMAVDLGERRIGVAVGDLGIGVATGHTVLDRSGSPEGDWAELAALAAELGVGRVVVGLPLSLDGTRGRAAQAAEAEAGRLGEVLGLPVELFDERLTTTEAHADLARSGLSSRRRRHVVDQVAAAVLLQAWIDGRRQRSGAADARGGGGRG